MRSNCGFGLLKQSTLLDQAASNHANWQLKNNYVGHLEVASVTNGFTGILPTDRATYTGYSWTWDVRDAYVSETGTSTKNGAYHLRTLLSAPYHTRSLLSEGRDIGIAIRNDVDAGSTATYGQRVVTQMDLSSTSAEGTQLIAEGSVATYPCAGSDGLNYALRNESPNPVPGRDLAVNPVGHPIIVMGRAGSTVAITSVVLTNLAGGSAVAMLTPVTSSNDPNSSLPTHVSFVLPDQPLSPNASYQAIVNGTLNGTPFSRTFTFNTGSGS